MELFAELETQYKQECLRAGFLRLDEKFHLTDFSITTNKENQFKNVMFLDQFVKDIGDAKPEVKCLKRDIKVHVYNDVVWIFSRNYSQLVAKGK